MKANELMIGDWVISNDLLNRPARYAGIFTEHTPLKGQPYRRLRCMWPGDIAGADVPEERVLPIHLTSEILEKNGFERLGTDYILMGQPFGLTNPSSPDYYKDNYWLRVAATSVNIKFVHQLQHALRLCGIEKEITI